MQSDGVLHQNLNFAVHEPSSCLLYRKELCRPWPRPTEAEAKAEARPWRLGYFRSSAKTLAAIAYQHVTLERESFKAK